MKIKFVEPNMLHPDSNVSVFEVAKQLEKIAGDYFFLVLKENNYGV